MLALIPSLPDWVEPVARYILFDGLPGTLRVSAIAVRLIDQTWFRPGSERYARESRTYGVTAAP